MKTFRFALLLMAFTLAASAETPPAAREGIEWCDIWISHANETNLPRVLLIGDSITRVIILRWRAGSPAGPTWRA